VTAVRPSARRELRRVGRLAGFGALTGAMLPVFLAHQRLVSAPEQSRVRERWVAAWCSAMLRLFGVTPIVRGPLLARKADERVPGRLVVANHRSTADVLLLLRAFGGRMVSRADLARWPLVGRAARAVGTVFVDRSDAVSGARTVRAMGDRLAAGDAVIVFPEGTTYEGDEVRPFRDGAFVAAIRGRADVLPVGLAYARASGAAFVNEPFGSHLARMAAAAPSRVAMCVGEPIPSGDFRRAALLRERAQGEVQRLVVQARGIVDEPT